MGPRFFVRLLCTPRQECRAGSHKRECHQCQTNVNVNANVKVNPNVKVNANVNVNVNVNLP